MPSPAPAAPAAAGKTSGRIMDGMARPAGLEPATTGLEGRCSIRLSYGRPAGLSHSRGLPGPDGRGRGIRTPDILLPKQARYQAALYPAARNCLSFPRRANATKGRLFWAAGNTLSTRGERRRTPVYAPVQAFPAKRGQGKTCAAAIRH